MIIYRKRYNSTITGHRERVYIHIEVYIVPTLLLTHKVLQPTRAVQLVKAILSLRKGIRSKGIMFFNLVVHV